jgi:hypothetical protein
MSRSSVGAFFTGFVFVVNLVMGTGGLAVPRAFYLAGWALGTMVMVASSFFACVTISWHFDGLLRAHAVSEAFRRRLIALVPVAPLPAPKADDVELGEVLVGASRESLGGGSHVSRPREIMASDHSNDAANSSASDDGHAIVNNLYIDATASVPPALTLREAMAQCHGIDFTIEARLGGCGSDEKAAAAFPPTDYSTFTPNTFFEVGDVLLLFGGRGSVYLWNCGLVGYVACVLWVYTVVLSETAALAIPLIGLSDRLECTTARIAVDPKCLEVFRIFVTIFSAMLFLLVMRDWRMMPLLQKVLTVLVYLILTIIVVTSILGLSTEYFPSPDVSETVRSADGNVTSTKMVVSTSGRAEAHYIQSLVAFDFDNFGDLFGISSFAMMCHTGSTFMLRKMPSLALTKPVFRVAMGVVCVVYTLTALVVALYLGGHTESLTTLNWGFYGKQWGPRTGLAQFLGTFVMCFPLFSVTAAYIITLRSCTDALEFILPIAWRKAYCAKFGREYTPFNEPNTFSVWPLQFSLRTGLLLVGFTLSLISPKFNSAIAVASLFGFLILFAVPLIVQLQSQRVLRRIGMDPVTPFEDWTSRMPMLVTVGVVGAVSLVYYTLSHLIPQLFGVKVL